jgi:hypothetical protein
MIQSKQLNFLTINLQNYTVPKPKITTLHLFYLNRIYSTGYITDIQDPETNYWQHPCFYIVSSIFWLRTDVVSIFQIIPNGDTITLPYLPLQKKLLEMPPSICYSSQFLLQLLHQNKINDVKQV